MKKIFNFNVICADCKKEFTIHGSFSDRQALEVSNALKFHDLYCEDCTKRREAEEKEKEGEITLPPAGSSEPLHQAPPPRSSEDDRGEETSDDGTPSSS